ncbi:hypothetical protein [Ornithinimicrobium kibberense]|uniref:hypothetical protein n=1 Tax=Ornithinimicrobium kibberense TaxID=282060 RepID=UPI003607407E
MYLRQLGDLGLLQTALVGTGGVQPVEETAQRGALGAGCVAGGHVREGVQLGAAPGGVEVGVRRHLEVQAQGAFRLDHEVGQGQPGQRTEPAQHRGQSADPVPALGRELAAPGAEPADGWWVVERLGQHRCVLPPVGPGTVARPAQLTRPGPEGVHVPGPQPADGAGEQPHHLIPAGGFLGRPQHGDQVEDLGGVEQPAQPDHLHRQPSSTQRVDHRRELGPGPAEHGRRAARTEVLGHPAGDVVGLLDLIDEPGHLDQPGARGGRGRQRPDGDPGGRLQVPGDGVGGGQHAAGVAP